MSDTKNPEEVTEIISDVAEKVGEMTDKIADKADNLIDKAAGLKDDIADKTAEIADRLADKTDAVKDIVAEVADKAADAAESVPDKVDNYADKSLAELSQMFENLKGSVDSMSRSKEAESIKASFYKLLSKLKAESGESDGEDKEEGINSPFETVEQNFKAMYSDYKKERAGFNKLQDAQREENLETKRQIVEDLKTLVDGQEDVSAQFPAFREIQNRWRDAGPVPATAYRDINDTYQFYVEKFYDMVKINRDLRDLDFKKNLEAKEAFCAAAEKLSENENIVEAFHELQKLHEQWKEYGPVAKEKREEIWNRFKAATAIINKKYQSYFEGLKGQQEENLEKKTALCVRVEEIAAREVKSSAEWNSLSTEIEGIQAEWRKIGFATKKENQAIYDRFRAACDVFFGRKREFYSGIKESMNENIGKKQALIDQAETLKSSTDWKKSTDQFISLQKQWKEIGAVPRNKSEQLWKKFRAACDEFFANRDANVSPENDFYGNLKAKKALVEEVVAFKPSDDETANADAMRAFNDRWQAIGHVPFKEKDNIVKSFRDAMQEKFPLFSSQRSTYQPRGARPVRSPKEILIDKYHALQQDITTYENNIGFFSASKNSEPLIQQMQHRIDESKDELKELEAQIRKAEEEDK